jgi:plastocyanin
MEMVLMQNRWLLIILVIALVMISGCAEDQTEADDATAQSQEPEDEQDGSETSVESVQHSASMEFFGFVPTTLDINKGDTVSWRNNNKQRVYTLISDEEIFENQEMKYGNIFYYVFENSGTYTFSVKDTPEMTMTVNVR